MNIFAISAICILLVSGTDPGLHTENNHKNLSPLTVSSRLAPNPFDKNNPVDIANTVRNITSTNLITDKTRQDIQTASSSFQFELNHWYGIVLLLCFSMAIFYYTRRLRKRNRPNHPLTHKVESEWSYALDFLDDPIYMVDLNDRLLHANKAFFEKVNTTREYALGKKVTEFTHPEGETIPCKVCQARRALLDTTITLEADYPANKTGIPLEISIKTVRDDSQQPVAIIQRMHDLTETRNIENTIRKSEHLFRSLLDTTPDPLVAVNLKGKITLVNHQFEKQLGYSREDIIGQDIEVLVPEISREKHRKLREEYHNSQQFRTIGVNSDLFIMHADGHKIPIDISLAPFEIGSEPLIISTLHDISERKNNEKEFRRMASFPEQNPMPIVEYSIQQDRLTYINLAAKRHFPDMEKKSSCHPVIEQVKKLLPELLINNETTRDVEYNHVIYEANIVFYPSSNLVRLYLWDITKLREMSTNMAYQATHDSLTSLPNRREFEANMEAAILSANLDNKEHMVCYMDLDNFKIVNDTCGHVAGDELLRQLASLLKNHVRDSDTLARIGGDEFGLLLKNCNSDMAEKISEKIRRSIEDFRFIWQTKTFKIGVSIGLVSVKKDSGRLSDILSAADTACYIAKDRGRNQIHTYRINDTILEKHMDEMNWIHRINDALENNHFVLHAQKILSLSASEPDIYEILIRLVDEHNNIILPTSFLNAAERYNLITDIDLWVVATCLGYFEKPGMKNYQLSINLSGQTLSNSRSMSYIVEKISNQPEYAKQLCFEITETAMIADINSAIHSLDKLCSLGCKIALDDFGSGLSSFSYLKNLPVNYLKIDGDFVRNMDNDIINAAMVESIIQVGHKMGLTIIAEHVENSDILSLLRTLNINYVQGYAIEHAIPIDALITENIKPACV